MQINPRMALCSYKECACRDVTTERKPYPSFAPEDFPAVYEASQKALQLASLAQAKAPESQARHSCHLVWHLNRHTQLTCIMAATVVISCMLHASARSSFGSRLRWLWEASLAQSRALVSQTRQFVSGQGSLTVHFAALCDSCHHRHTPMVLQ